MLPADGPSPHPGGSPFPPGGEPALTHVVKAYWTTLDDVVARIDVTAKGARPIQYEVMGMQTGMAPDCDVHLRISTAALEPEDGLADYRATGQGTIVVRVYGFNREDLVIAPQVSVRYFKDGRQLGETIIERQPAREATGGAAPSEPLETKPPP